MALLLVTHTWPAEAQSQRPDLTVGYQYQWVPAGQIPGGFNLDVSVPIGTGIGTRIVGQFDWSRKTESEPQLITTQTVSMVGAGLRLTGGGSTIRPFFQLVAGITRNAFHDVFSTNNVPYLAGRTIDNSSTFATIQVGGGAAVSLTRRLGAVWELDYRPYIHDSTVSHSGRALVGIRINLR